MSNVNRGLNQREAKERAAAEKRKAEELSKKEEKLDLLLARKEETMQVWKAMLLISLEDTETSGG